MELCLALSLPWSNEGWFGADDGVGWLRATLSQVSISCLGFQGEWNPGVERYLFVICEIIHSFCVNILYNCWFLHTTGRLFFVSMGLNERGRTSDHCVTAELKNWILLDLYIYIYIYQSSWCHGVFKQHCHRLSSGCDLLNGILFFFLTR